MYMHTITQGFINEFDADCAQISVTFLSCVQHRRPITTIYLHANIARVYNKQFQAELTGF